MLRDMIKDENYFNKYIAYQNERIAKFESILTQNSLEESKIKQCNEYLANYKLDLIKAKYSVGESIDELNNIFLSFMENVKKSNEISYTTAIEVLSLSIIFDYTQVEYVLNLISDKDDLINFLYKFACNKNLINVNSCIFPKVYSEFITVIQNKDDQLLIKYMQDDWYYNNMESYWYDSHNLSSEVYAGYWCFVSIAIIKALDFDIDRFNKVRFVPIDML